MNKFLSFPIRGGTRMSRLSAVFTIVGTFLSRPVIAKNMLIITWEATAKRYYAF